MNGKYESRPKSKQPKSKAKKFLIFLLMIPLYMFVFLIVIAIIVAATADQKPKQAQKQAAETVVEQAKIGATVADGGFNFVVNSIKCGETHLQTSGLVYTYNDAQGQFCRLNITVTNTGNTADSIGVSAQYLFSDQGQKYDSDSGATATAANALAGSPLNAEVNPGNSVTGDIVYDVPIGVAPTTAELHASYSSKGAKVDLR